MIAILAGCGGGGGTGAISGLQGPQQVSIVEAQGGGASPVRIVRGGVAAGLSDYDAAQTHFWIDDESMDALEVVNQILGYLGETNYWDATVINEGPYIAMITQESRGGDGRGGSGVEYEEWIVDSSRANNSAPQIVKFWINQKEEDQTNTVQEQVIYGHLTVTQEPTDGNPLGVFTLNFKQLLASQSHDDPNVLMEGYLRSIARTDGQSEVEFFLRQGDADATPATNEFAMRQRMHVVGQPDADTGRGYVEWKQVSNFGSVQQDGGEYNVQFNADFLARKNLLTTTEVVLDRDDFETSVHRYGLYVADTGDRVDLNGGFPVETLNGARGFVGHHGLWFPEGITITDGQTLIRRNRDEASTTTNYTAVLVPGRLEKRTRQSLTLADILGEQLDSFSQTLGSEVRAQWDGTAMMATAVRSGNSWTPLSPPLSLASNYTTGQWVTFWSQARGSIEFEWPASLSGSIPVYVWSSSTVDGSSPDLANGDLTLFAYDGMLRSNITSNQANFQSSETPYFPPATNVGEGKSYVFGSTTLMLTLSGNPVALGTGVAVTQGPGLYGLNCGPLLPAALTSLSEMSQQSTTYQWYTGTNDWNQLRTVKDGQGNFVTFDQPIRLSYTHSEVGSPYDGRTFFLEWDGNHLGGIPYEQEQSTGNWMPLLNIPSGTVITSGNTSYKVKQLEGEQAMNEEPNPSTIIANEGFDLSTSVTQPSASGVTDPAIGVMPTVTAPPKFIGGIAQ